MGETLISSIKIGKPPGALIHVGEQKMGAPEVHFYDFLGDQFFSKTLKDPNDLASLYESSCNENNTWIALEGLHDPAWIESLGKVFNIHPLVQEDILNTNQRPKIEEFENYLFGVVRLIYWEVEGGNYTLASDQFSFILFPSLLMTFQEKKWPLFDPVIERISSNKGKIRKSGVDYLAYTLLDALIDENFQILNDIGEEVELLEEQLFFEFTEREINIIHDLKRKLIMFRKIIWSSLDMFHQMVKAENPIIKTSTRLYLRDILDHTHQLLDQVDNDRENLNSLFDIYMSRISLKLNEVMKVLTLMASIFIPLTFIVGIYGMNFEKMPGIKNEWGFLGICTTMAVIALGMVFFFKTRKWI